ncbi:hypothetical protein MAR_029645 [Mya arenaria]|uniref:Uncharacterized protein n=1 Tax=Mya arenaria TaxID=6604 RepID=A0ABY7DKS8_MYAAR|nr:uncharacterized protein LOC128244048 [Mya arenaria]WAQ96955.1 hypothetical protein MAR_029645 [Mya arenaria]
MQTMKTRKRERSPNQNCDDCLPISKRITRLNIKATGRNSTEDAEIQSTPGTRSCQNQCDVNQLPWTQTPQPVAGSSGANNNTNFLPCGSSQCGGGQYQCDGVQHQMNSVQAYAAFHDVPTDDFGGYKPDLTSSENPHYYHINSVLYFAHLQKASREGMELKQ